MAERRGTRCGVCTGCGRCFEDGGGSGSEAAAGWSGERCELCVGCGRCLEAWGLGPGSSADGESGATNWADAFKAMDTGQGSPSPPVPGAPGGAPGSCESPDAVTGATPGVAAACRELGLDDMESLNRSLGIKPPGIA